MSASPPVTLLEHPASLQQNIASLLGVLIAQWARHLLSYVRLFATPSTVAWQAPPSLGFSRQEYWSGLPFSSPRDLPDPGIEPESLALQTEALPSEPPGKPREVIITRAM